MTMASDQTAAGPAVLATDPDTGLASVVAAGDLVFLSSVEGLPYGQAGGARSPLAGDGPAQARRAYQEVAARLGQAGLSGRSLVRVENVTASQDWRLQRMALWPEVFGSPTQAVSQGYQGKMRGQNMITVTGVAVRDGIRHEVVRPGPSDQRAARIVRGGDFLFVIGVRGLTDLAAGQKLASGELAGQITVAYRNIEYWLAQAGAGRRQLVRYDAYLRDINRAMDYRAARTAHFGGQMSVASTVVGCPLGGLGDLEISAIALVPGATPEVTYLEGRDDLARCVRAGGLVFASGMLGNRDPSGALHPQAYTDVVAQLELARARLTANLATFGARWQDIARLDVYLTDPYQQERATDWVRSAFACPGPAVGFYGIELEPGALAELTAVATAP
jgi:enamine deaminase RidA (YjgF/YER057c/UK114 family)